MSKRSDIQLLITSIKILICLIVIKIFNIRVDETTMNIYIFLQVLDVFATTLKKTIFKWSIVLLQVYLLIIMLPFNNMATLINFVSAVVCSIIVLVVSCIEFAYYFKNL